MKSCIVIALVPLLVTFGCASDGSGSRSRSSSNSNDASANAKPSPIGIANDTPQAVRAIEAEIDRTSVILADRIDIEVSNNYQFDVSLIGDDVTKDLDQGGANERHATGNSVAFVRNLQLRADQGIRVFIADVGTAPFIRVRARGHCSHITEASGSSQSSVRRAEAVILENDEFRYVDVGELPAHLLETREKN